MTQKSSQLMFKNQGMPSLIGCQQVWKSSSIKLDASNFSTAGNDMLQRCWHTPVIAPLLVMFRYAATDISIFAAALYMSTAVAWHPMPADSLTTRPHT